MTLPSFLFCIFSRLRKEVLDVVGVKSFIGNEDLKEMTYLDMVIKETLRINPPAPNTFRQTSHDMEISGYKIPVGTSIGVSLTAAKKIVFLNNISVINFTISS